MLDSRGGRSHLIVNFKGALFTSVINKYKKAGTQFFYLDFKHTCLEHLVLIWCIWYSLPKTKNLNLYFLLYLLQKTPDQALNKCTNSRQAAQEAIWRNHFMMMAAKIMTMTPYAEVEMTIYLSYMCYWQLWNIKLKVFFMMNHFLAAPFTRKLLTCSTPLLCPFGEAIPCEDQLINITAKSE